MISKSEKLKKLADAISHKIGYENTCNLFSAIEKAGLESKNDIVTKFIVINVAHLYGMDEKDVMESSSHKSSMARNVCYVLLKKHLDLSYIQIANHFLKTSQLIWLSIGKLNELLNQTEVEQEMISVYNQVNSNAEILMYTIKNIK